MREPRRIFISHNSESTPESKRFLLALKAELESQLDENGNNVFLPLVDHQLKPADPWRGVLYNWMSSCHGAVILLDENSTKSPWVPREAMIFTFLKQQDTSFYLLPVLLGSATKDIFFEPAFRDLGLNDFDFIKHPEASEVVESLKSQTNTPAGQGSANLVQLLSGLGDLRITYLYEQCRQLLDLDSNPSFSSFYRIRRLAASLLGYGFRQGPFRAEGKNFPSARALAAMAKNVDADAAWRIFDAVRPYWVDHVTSASLFKARKTAKVIALRLTLKDSGWPLRAVEDYFAHAYAEYTDEDYKLVPIEPVTIEYGIDDEVTFLRSRIIAALVDRFFDLEKTSDEEVITLTRNRDGELFCYVVQSDAIKLEHVIQMQHDFQHLRLIYLCFDDSCRSNEEVCYLEPSPEGRFEAAAKEEIITAASYLPRRGTQRQ